MIIYGSRAKQVAKGYTPDQCPNCNTQNMEMHVFQKYAHVFWIPFFPIGKTGVSQCNNCKQVLESKKMSGSLKMSYDNMKAETKTPVWMFSGLAIIALLIVVGIVSDQQKNAKNAKLILKPQTGDVFEIKTKENQYTLYKVDHTEGDSVFLLMNNFETNKVSGLGDLRNKGASSWSDEYILPLAKPELKEMFDKGEIIDIERK